MADLIKKIKIKKQDDTYTDYIPIGADAKNVEMKDGESVESKMNRKPYYYRTVAEMKEDNRLKDGEVAITLGYYEVNDGGAAEYYITGEIKDSEWQENIDNNLYATLLTDIKNINVLQLGVKRNVTEDQSVIVNKILQLPMKKIFYFPIGRYYFTHKLINNKRHDIIGDVNTATDFDRQINGTRFYFTEMQDNDILIDCYNGSRCSIRDIYVINDNVEITLDKSLFSDGTIPSDIFTKTIKNNNIIGIRLGNFGNQLQNVAIYGCNIGISANTYNVLTNVAIMCCEIGLQCYNDNTMTNINCQRCETGILIKGGLNNFSQVRLDSIRYNGLEILSGANANNINNFIADICQYASILINNSRHNVIDGVIGRSGTYYVNFEPSPEVDATKACKVCLKNSSAYNRIHIIAYRGNATDNDQTFKFISTYIVACSGSDDNHNSHNDIEIVGKVFENDVEMTDLLTIDQLKKIYNPYKGYISGTVTFQGITYIIPVTRIPSESNIRVLKPVKYSESLVVLNQYNNLDMGGNKIVNVNEMRIGNSTEGWVSLQKSSEQGNLKVQNISSSYTYTDAQITGVAAPTLGSSAVNKSYVDNL